AIARPPRRRPPRSTPCPSTTLSRSLLALALEPGRSGVRQAHTFAPFEDPCVDATVPVLAGHDSSAVGDAARIDEGEAGAVTEAADRKSTRLNSSHVKHSYAVLCSQK